MGLINEYATSSQRIHAPKRNTDPIPPIKLDLEAEAIRRLAETAAAQPQVTEPESTDIPASQVRGGHIWIAVFLSGITYFMFIVLFMMTLVFTNPSAYMGLATIDPAPLAEQLSRTNTNFFTIMLVPTTLGYIIGIFVGIAFIGGRIRNQWTQLGIQSADPQMLRYASQNGLMGGLLISGGSLLGLGLAGQLPAIHSILSNAVSIIPNGAIVIGLLLAVVALPFAEALLYRGVIYRYLRQRNTPLVAMLLSAVVFATFNANLQGFFPSLFLGILLAIVFERTQNLWATFLTHSLFNFVTILLYVVLLWTN